MRLPHFPETLSDVSINPNDTEQEFYQLHVHKLFKNMILSEQLASVDGLHSTVADDNVQVNKIQFVKYFRKLKKRTNYDSSPAISAQASFDSVSDDDNNKRDTSSKSNTSEVGLINVTPPKRSSSVGVLLDFGDKDNAKEISPIKSSRKISSSRSSVLQRSDSDVSKEGKSQQQQRYLSPSAATAAASIRRENSSSSIKMNNSFTGSSSGSRTQTTPNDAIVWTRRECLVATNELAAVESVNTCDGDINGISMREDDYNKDFSHPIRLDLEESIDHPSVSFCDVSMVSMSSFCILYLTC